MSKTTRTMIPKRSPNRNVAKRYVSAGITFEPEMLGELDRYCDQHFVARSIVVRWALRNFLNAVKEGGGMKRP
jgi:metal-responsive CopG/Arc/MetJ family transcriptional regulator